MAQLGRNMIVTVGGVALASVKETSFKVNKELIDVSTKSSSGFREFLDKCGSKSIDIGLEGLMVENAIRTLAISPNDNVILSSVVLDYETGVSISGTFALSGYSESGPYNEAVTASFELQSTGPWSVA